MRKGSVNIFVFLIYLIYYINLMKKIDMICIKNKIIKGFSSFYSVINLNKVNIQRYYYFRRIVLFYIIQILNNNGALNR